MSTSHIRGCTIELRDRADRSYRHDRAALYQVAFTGTYDDLLSQTHSGDVVLDAGANIGVFTVLASKRVGPDGLVVAIEPEPENSKRLQRHIEINRLSNVTTIQGAIFSRSGGSISFSGFGVAGHLSESGELEVPSITMHDVLHRLGVSHFDVVKMDIEGAEREAFNDSTFRSSLRLTRALSAEIHSDEAEVQIWKELTEAGFGRITIVREERQYLPRLLRRVLAHPVQTLSLWGPDAIPVARRVFFSRWNQKFSSAGAPESTGVLYAERKAPEQTTVSVKR